MQIKLAFSPCPNDTFIFYAMLHGRVDTEGLTFLPYLSDVEDLNNLALQEKAEITKISFHAYCHAAAGYVLLQSGAALGRGCGPLLISLRDPASLDLSVARVAIPGPYTTAAFLLKTFYPQAVHLQSMVFSGIEPALLSGTVDAGVIIHENRFTYRQKGLQKISDLGERWEQETGKPIPLGGIAIRRDFPAPVQEAAGRVMRRSVEYAFAHREEVMPYVRKYAQEMEEAVMLQHIELYVNEYTVSLGADGEAAVRFMMEQALSQGLFHNIREPLFVS